MQNIPMNIVTKKSINIFAISFSMYANPEILILDEVLSVGDVFFREKSLERVKRMIHGGSTVLLVSHSIDTIIQNCTKAVWIDKGIQKMVGEPKTVCEAYQNAHINHNAN